MIRLLPVVAFRHQDCWFGIEAGCVRSRSFSQPASAVRAPSFASLLDGNTEWPVRQWLLLRGQQQDWSLGIQGEAELLEVSAEQIHPLPPLLAARSTFLPLRALAFDAGRLLLLLDPLALENLAQGQVSAVV